MNSLKATKKHRQKEAKKQFKEVFDAKEKELEKKMEAMTEDERIAYYQHEKAKENNVIQTLAVASIIAEMSGGDKF